MDSHIQMPKLLLKRFHNEYNRFYYYDVEKAIIGTKGTAESINTKFGYYSKDTEDFLNKEIEDPFGKILKYLEEADLKAKPQVAIRSNISEPVLNFMYGLIVRAPSFHQMMCEEDNSLCLLSEEKKREYIIKIGLKIAKENSVFNDYIVTFMIDNTDIPFVLSMNGIYNYTFNGYQAINLPISPHITISLIHNDYSHRVFHDDGAVSMFVIDRPENIMLMNSQAFLFQVKHKWGYVVCSQKNELERLANI